jgi:hypothetical protein
MSIEKIDLVSKVLIYNHKSYVLKNNLIKYLNTLLIIDSNRISSDQFRERHIYRYGKAKETPDKPQSFFRAAKKTIIDNFPEDIRFLLWDKSPRSHKYYSQTPKSQDWIFKFEYIDHSGYIYKSDNLKDAEIIQLPEKIEILRRNVTVSSLIEKLDNLIKNKEYSQYMEVADMLFQMEMKSAFEDIWLEFRSDEMSRLIINYINAIYHCVKDDQDAVGKIKRFQENIDDVFEKYDINRNEISKLIKGILR